MIIIGRNLLTEFCSEHADARSSVAVWIGITEKASWKKPLDVIATFSNANVIKGKLGIFNIKNNDYRLETNLSFSSGVVSVIWIGKHKEYDKRNQAR
jgi:mRNA interferase HigB